jgi:hypothetical protein
VHRTAAASAIIIGVALRPTGACNNTFGDAEVTVASDPPPQPRHLTLIELVASYALFAGVGYWIAGALGAWVGAGLVTAGYAYAIWVAIRTPKAGPAAKTTADAEPGATPDQRGT